MTSVAWLDWATVFFDLLKGIAWPTAIFLTVWIFRKELRERVRDLISAGPGGAVFQPPQQKEVAAIKHENVLAINANSLGVVQTVEGWIRRDLNDFQEASRVDRLIRALAEARVGRFYDGVFYMIYDTQIQFLRHLQTERFPVDSTQAYFDAVVTPANKELYAGKSFQDWAHFLLWQQLVEISEGEIHLTEFGRDFVKYLDRERLGQPRPN